MVGEKKDFLGLNQTELEAFVGEIGEKKFRGKQLYSWIYHRRISDFALMTDLSLKFRDFLPEIASIGVPIIEQSRTAAEGFTRKLQMQLSDGEKIESVLMREKARITLCVSTQVGCPLSCEFCATGMMGFKRNLSAGEIVGQLLAAAKETAERITNVVLMGMGEPLLNYDNVAKALRLFSDGDGLAISSRKITLSSVGIIPGIDRLTQDRLPCKLAISLNAPEENLRNKLMPINKKYPLKELLPALHRYEKTTRHRVTFEYVLLGGVNDSEHQARKLQRLLGGFTAKLNLIAYNPIDFANEAGTVSLLFKPPSESQITRFREIVERPGLTVTLRKSQGREIAAACGQLCLKDKSPLPTP